VNTNRHAGRVKTAMLQKKSLDTRVHPHRKIMRGGKSGSKERKLSLSLSPFFLTVWMDGWFRLTKKWAEMNAATTTYHERQTQRQKNYALESSQCGWVVGKIALDWMKDERRRDGERQRVGDTYTLDREGVVCLSVHHPIEVINDRVNMDVD
jgi:hypothetical protein